LRKHQNFAQVETLQREVTERTGLISASIINRLQLEKLLTPIVETPTTVYQPAEVAHYDNIIVHFDLKGAPPKVAYLKQVLELIKHNGATGILIEWEDTFPFTGIFEDIRASNGYTMAEVKEMLSHAQKLELDIIPLVQTFGHLEWILKVAKFRKYRQSDMYP
uniref:Beta-N-acetylhexosaminidase n=1 Tax=Parascaris univalens TaxID=6257 RepID=A0A915C4Z2_PARUN